MNTKPIAKILTSVQPPRYFILLVVSLFLGTHPTLARPATDTTATLPNLTIATWGEYNATQQHIPTELYDIVAVAAGYEHSVVLKRDSTVVLWDNTPSAPLASATLSP